LGGVFHSDELPNYGIEEAELEQVKKILEVQSEDGFLILAGQSKKLDVVIDAIIKRIEEAKMGVPAETRAATSTGETVYLRPRPGASRMYPETDIPPVIVDKKELEEARIKVPKSWEESLLDLQKQYELNSQLALQIFDSEYLDLFESISRDKRVAPNFVASVLCGTITNLERRGLDSTLLKNSDIFDAFGFLAEGKIAKESLEIIFESIMNGKASSITDAIQKNSITTMDDTELNKILDELIKSNIKMIEQQGLRSVAPLMGLAMKTLRGKADGQRINQLLEKKIKSQVNTS